MGQGVMERASGAATNGPIMNGAGGGRLRSYAPATGELIGEAPNTTAEQVRHAVARAHRAQQTWAALSPKLRADKMLAFRDALVDSSDELVDLLTRECGKPRQEALLHEVMVTAEVATYFAKSAAKTLATREVELRLMKHRKSFVRYAPRGVIGVISPWNYPLQLPMRDVIMATMAGNAVVLKPSEITPLIAIKAKEIWDASGMPEDLFQVVTGYGATGAALVESDVQMIVFTGGVETGRKVAAACGERLIPCVMELGGKAPLIACADADLERTARAVVFGGFTNSGQVCISVERVYAHREIHDKLVERVIELVGELRQGDPSQDAVELGAIIFPPQLEVIERHIADATAKGAVLRAGGKRVPGRGQYFEPTILTNCDHTMSVMTAEIFGPIVPIMRVSSEEEAVTLANESSLGLNAYVFSSDREHGRRLAERIEAGSVLVNDVVSNAGCPEVPFGGVKQSGFGRVMGADALRDLCDVRHVSVDRFSIGAKDPHWFPYTQSSLDWLKRGMRVIFSRANLWSRLKRS